MKKVSKSFVTGAVALVFAVLGYQTALLVHYAAVTKITADRDRPDTVYVWCTPETGNVQDYGSTISRDGGQPSARPVPGSGSSHRHTERRTMDNRSPIARKIRSTVPPRRIENFRFNPNEVSVEDLLRLGFSPKQAESIDRYRKKGGRFRRKEDFAKSYVVSDSVFRRLEPYIDIPAIDLNRADSAAFDSLPGIGGYFARRMVEYRVRLHGYSYPEQLMDIYNFDAEKYDALKDLVTVSPPTPYPVWTLPEDSLRQHPYIGASAHGIVLFRDNNPKDKWNVRELEAAGIISGDQAAKLGKCVLGE